MTVDELPHQETSMRDGIQVLTGRPPFYMNWMEQGQTYEVDVYLSSKDKNEFFGVPRQRKAPGILTAKPVWTLTDLTFSMDHEESN